MFFTIHPVSLSALYCVTLFYWRRQGLRNGDSLGNLSPVYTLLYPISLRTEIPLLYNQCGQWCLHLDITVEFTCISGYQVQYCILAGSGVYCLAQEAITKATECVSLIAYSLPCYFFSTYQGSWSLSAEQEPASMNPPVAGVGGLHQWAPYHPVACSTCQPQGSLYYLCL